MVIAAVVIVAAFVVGSVLISIVYRLQTPRELRGDWWATFEKDFRDYDRRRRRAAR